jgi:ABC-2 type transport system permease protein
VTYLPSLLLSNFVFPRENMPALLKMITYVIPATYYIDILNGLYLRNVSLSYLWPSFGVLFLMFFFLSALNILILKKEGL